MSVVHGYGYRSGNGKRPQYTIDLDKVAEWRETLAGPQRGLSELIYCSPVVAEAIVERGREQQPAHRDDGLFHVIPRPDEKLPFPLAWFGWFVGPLFLVDLVKLTIVWEE